MHILWINENANFMGGAENYIYKTVCLLNAQNIKSSVLYSVDPTTEPKWTSAFSEAYPLVNLQYQLDALKPDIIYLHQWPGGETLKQLLNSGIPLIRFIHDSEIFSTKETHLTTFGRKESMTPIDYKWYFLLLNKLQQFKKTLLYKKDLMNFGNKNRQQTMLCDGLVIASEYTRTHIIEHGCEKDKILVNPLFVNQPKNIIHSPPEKNHLLFIGQLVRGKGVDLILQAMAHMKKKPQLTICGDGKQKDELIRLSEYLGLTDNVAFKGYVDSEDLPTYYQEATCIIVPSRIPETFCLTGPEAMAYKTPVISSSLGGMTEWQENGAVLTFKENDYHSLKEAIETLLSDKDMQLSLAEKGQQLCAKKLLPEAHTSRLLTFMKEKIQEKRLTS
jgi:glycosyltransferase involved in cell wall biosynthesis